METETMSEDHHHDHDHEAAPPHHHDLRAASERKLWWALAINLVFLIVEVAGGLITHSLALLADAGHMLTDVAALGLALFVSWLASRPATPERTYGFIRAEVLGAFVNGATLFLIVGLIIREAWLRIGEHVVIAGPLMLAIAGAGLLANLGSAAILYGKHDNVNLRGAFLHMALDALGSIGAMVAGAVIWLAGWTLIDPIVSLVIALLIVVSSFNLVRETIAILLESTPKNIDFLEVKKALEAIEHVANVHDLHIWTITSGVPLLSAHLSLAASCCDTSQWQQTLNRAQALLQDRFGIDHTTLQIENADTSCQGECQLIENNHQKT